MSWGQLKNLVLENARVRLRRVGVGDIDAFREIAFDPAIWRHFVTRIETADDLDRFIEQAVQDTLNGTRIVFAVIDKASERIVGSSAYGNLSETERKLEIGWSWLAERARGSGVNRAAKLCLLDHAFDTLGCERVEFKTDVLNVVARAALASIGGREEGVLRSFNYMPGGRRRDVVYYSILRDEWHAVRRERFAGETDREPS